MTERFSASVAARHMTCHASANLDLAIPGWVPPVEDRNKDNAANRGTSMHEMLAKLNELPAREIKAFGRALEYIGDVRSRRRFKVLIEQSVTAKWLTTQPTTQADLVLYTQDEIHVLDFKWGSIPVEVVGNEQLLFYAVCFARLAPKAKGVSLHVVQPNADNCESWFADTTVLAQFMSDALAAEAAIQSGSTQFGPSDHCKFCPANPHSRGEKGSPLCPSMMQLLYPSVVHEDEILSL